MDTSIAYPLPAAKVHNAGLADVIDSDTTGLHVHKVLERDGNVAFWARMCIVQGSWAGDDEQNSSKAENLEVASRISGGVV